MLNNIAFIILTFNEEKHISRCIASAKSVSDNIHVVDSFSNDNTEALCREANVKFHKHIFISHSNQINWALENINFNTKWIFRLDADEILSEPLVERLKSLSSNKHSDNINGYLIRRIIWFQGKKIVWGGMKNIYHLRMWRTGKASCEDKFMDERMIINEGHKGYIHESIYDININPLEWWISKHNKYSTNEVLDMIKTKTGTELNSSLFGTHDSRRRYFKKLYQKLPSLSRAWLFFIYRYFFRLGFLDGYQGFIFHFMQCLWYRTLIDAKYKERTR